MKRGRASRRGIDTSPCLSHCVWIGDARPPSLWIASLLYSAAKRCQRGSAGFDGELRGDSPILCTNPLTGMVGGEALAEANLGTLIPDADYTTGELVPGAVPARCDERGLLLIGDPPEVGDAVLPGNNYHVYDIPLFWRNLQRDVASRVQAWRTAR